MIRSLAGKIKDVGDGWIVISVNNIGYLVSCLTATENFKKIKKSPFIPIWPSEKMLWIFMVLSTKWSWKCLSLYYVYRRLVQSRLSKY